MKRLFTPNQVRSIRAASSNGMTARESQALFPSAGSETIRRIIRKEIYTDVTVPAPPPPSPPNLDQILQEASLRAREKP